MLISKDGELYELRRAHGLSDDVKFFLLEYEDLNFYHYGHASLDLPRTCVQRVRAMAKTRLKEPTDDVTDPLIELIAARANYRQPDKAVGYWKKWLSRLPDPAVLAGFLESVSEDRWPAACADMILLLHVIPQSCMVGVMRTVAEHFFTISSDPVLLTNHDDWDSRASTLRYLRPLEYVFGMGSASKRTARVHVLHGDDGVLHGTMFDFASAPTSSDTIRRAAADVSAMIDELAVRHLSDAMSARRQWSFEVLCSEGRRVMPLHSVLHWDTCDASPTLHCAYGLPWSRRDSTPRHVMAWGGPLDLSQSHAAVQWLEQRIVHRDAVPHRSGVLGSAFCHPLPNWAFTARNSFDPLTPRNVVTIVDPTEKEALQFLCPPLATRSDTCSATLEAVYARLLRARRAASIVTSADRYGAGVRSALPETWVYHPETRRRVDQVLDLVRRRWSGDLTPTFASPFVLFHGPPGTGKSDAARAIAASLVNAENVRSVSAADLFDSSFGRTERNIQKLFNDLCTRTEHIVIIDEVEQFGQATTDDILTNQVSFFRGQMDRLIRRVEVSPRAQVLLLGTTNHPDRLDGAIRSKFSSKIEFKWTVDEHRRLVALRSKLRWSAQALEHFEKLSAQDGYDPRRVMSQIQDLETAATEREVANVFSAVAPEVTEHDLAVLATGTPVGSASPMRTVSAIPVPSTQIAEWSRGFERAREAAVTHGYTTKREALYRYIKKEHAAVAAAACPDAHAELVRVLKANKKRATTT